MGRSRRVSEEELERVKKAFDRTGWTQDYLAGSVKCTRQTVNKFLAGKYIDKRFFEALCSELNLRVADIADLESEEGQLNTSVSINGNREQSLATLTQKPTETDEEKVSFSILGTASKVDLPKLKALVAHLQRITGDTSIEIVDIEKGSIRLILEGSQESLEQIEALFKSGELTEVEGIPVEDVQFVTPKIHENEKDIQAIDKKRLAFTIAGNVSSEEIEELKAAFSETSDNDEEIETDDKARLVRDNISQRAKRPNWIDALLRNTFFLVWKIFTQGVREQNAIGINPSDAKLRGAKLRGADRRGADD
jgi:transcriptional regulator with XRE-family HTH domain